MLKKSILLFLIVPCFIFSQNEIYEDAIKNYPDAKLVQLEDIKLVDISIDKKTGELLIKNKISEKFIYLSDRASQYSNQEISFNSFYDIDEIKAQTIVPDEKGKFKTFKVKTFSKKDDIGGNNFKDDSKLITFNFSNLKKGAISELEYTEILKEPFFISSFIIGNVYPKKHVKYEVVTDKDIQMNFKQFHTNDIVLTYEKKEEKGRIHHVFEINNLDEYDIEDDAPGIRYYIPHIITRIASYKYNGTEKNVLKDVSDLYKWYYSLVKDLNQNLSEELVNITDSLIKDKTNEIEKVEAIYKWVQDNIKYVAIEDGLGGFKPREASEVCSKRYGDCKDNSSIIIAMLKHAGIKGYYTWVGTRDIPYNYIDVPTPSADNHMIVTYKNNNNYYFLDATGYYQPIDLPPSFIQGKDVLIGIDESNYEIYKVPVVPPEKNNYSDSIFCQIEGDKLIGKGKVSINGYSKIQMLYDLNKCKNEKEEKEVLKIYLEKGNNKFILNDYKISNKESINSPLVIDYTFQIEDYIQKVNNELYINLNLEQEIAQLKIKKTKKYDLEIKFTVNSNVYTQLTLPENHTVSYIPENLKNEDEYISYDFNYKQLNNVVDFTSNVSIKKLYVPKNDFEKWNKSIKDINNFYREVVVLKEL
jgi:hypothetical protein